MTTTKNAITCAIILALLSACSKQESQLVQQTEKARQPGDTQQPASGVHKAVQEKMTMEADALLGHSSMQVKHKAQFQSLAMTDRSYQRENRDNYLPSQSNGVVQVKNSPLSTFSIDVDTGSYANSRSYLNMGKLPPADAIREEAFINYFDYQYQVPESKAQPFSLNSEISTAPWDSQRHLLRIAMKGYDIPASQRKPSNLVFLVDVSGSMNEANKLPLLVRSLSLLTANLTEQDSVSLVTYAGNSSVVLKPTKGNQQQAILNALKSLKSGGGTHGESGIRLAYQQAKSAYIKDGVNRIILATDGDFNVGTTSIDALKQLVEKEKDNGISLTTLGFGRGNYNDAMMEQLANIGDGNHAYIDTLHEAKKVLSRQMSGTLQSIASDVKIQIEFNPNAVKEYRLIGYQNRLLKDEDFNNDAVDAGEIGAGHTVTALYELTLAENKGQVDNLKYQQNGVLTHSYPEELAEIKVRYKLPGEKSSQRTSVTVKREQLKSDFSNTSSDFQFASAVAAFAQKLKDNKHMDGLSYRQIADIARSNRGNDPYNYRGEFITLVEIAESL